MLRRAFFTVGAALLAFHVWTGQVEAASFDTCLDMFPGASVPTQKSETIVDLCKAIDGQAIFAIRFDTTRKTPNWTAHRLTATLVARGDANDGVFKRPKFKPDPDVPENVQAVDDSYTNSGYQRGHMVPADDMSWAKAAYDATFILTNAVPQKAKLNNRAWRGLEDDFRDMARTSEGQMWAIAGTYGSVGTIGQSPHDPMIPKCFYKILIASDDNGTYKALATLFPWDAEERRREWIEAIVPLSLVETRTGIDFLAGLPVEAEFDAAYWGVDMPAQPADCP